MTVCALRAEAIEGTAGSGLTADNRVLRRGVSSIGTLVSVGALTRRRFVSVATTDSSKAALALRLALDSMSMGTGAATFGTACLGLARNSMSMGAGAAAFETARLGLARDSISMGTGAAALETARLGLARDSMSMGTGAAAFEITRLGFVLFLDAAGLGRGGRWYVRRPRLALVLSHTAADFRVDTVMVALIDRLAGVYMLLLLLAWFVVCE
jgi:hypothetical protein